MHPHEPRTVPAVPEVPEVPDVPDFSVTRRTVGPVAVVEVRGELDVETACAFRACARRALEHSPHVVVDLTRTGLLDCHCLGSLLSLARAAEQDGRSLRLAGASGAVRLLLEALAPAHRWGGRRTVEEELGKLLLDAAPS